MDTKDVIRDWQNRLQFTMIMVLFFPSFLSYLFPPEKISDLANIGIGWGSIIAILVLVYIAIELMKVFKVNIHRKWIANSVNFLLLFEIAAFLPLLFIGSMTKVTNGFLTGTYKFLVIGSIYSMMFIPVVIFLVLIINHTEYKSK